MEICLLKYFFLASTEDNQIKQVIENMLTHSQNNLTELNEFFIKENLTIPRGFTFVSFSKLAELKKVKHHLNLK